MTELAIKKDIKSNIYQFSKKDSLSIYLANYIISKEVFNYTNNLNDYEKNMLFKYYVDSKKRANKLVTEDEFVGITYDNLEIINRLIKKI